MEKIAFLMFLVLGTSVPSRGVFSTALADEKTPILVGNLPVSVRSVSSDELNSLLMGYSRSLNSGESVNMVVLGDRHPLTSGFLKDRLGKSVAQMKSHWSYLVFTGRGTPPQSFNSEGELLEYLSKNERTLGFVAKGTPFNSPVREVPVINR